MQWYLVILAYLHLGRNLPMHQAGADLLESSSVEKDLRSWWTVSCPWASSALGDKNANYILGWIRKNIARRSGRWSGSSAQPWWGQIWSTVSSWAAQERRDIELLEQVQQRLWKGLKDIPTRKGFGSWGRWASRGDTTKRGPYPSLSPSAGRAQRRDQTLFHGAQQQDKRQPTNLC